MERLTVIREHLKEWPAPVWAEPFHNAWTANVGVDERLRFARAQAAEMAAARPFIKPGELIIGNNAVRSIVRGLPTPFASGIRFDRPTLEELRRERPDAGAKLTEVESYWASWFADTGYVAPMAMHISLDWGRVLSLGIDGLRGHVERRRHERVAQRRECDPWYRGLLAVLDGLSLWIVAHASAAEQTAERAESGERRAELERIAAICRRVAHEPPRSFHEAVQLFYLVFWLCGHDSPGPIDRYLYPAFQRDREAGLPLDEAQELVDCLWLKFEEKTAYGATLGGVLPDGSDGANELSLLCVSSIRRLRLLSPRTALRWHRGISPELLDAACESIASGATFPALVNDEAILRAMAERGVALEHARDYTFVGCGQTFPHGRGHGNYEDVVLNSAKPLELALHDGIDPTTGERLGPSTGSAESFASWEPFEAAYRRQMDHHITQAIEAVNAHRRRIRDRACSFLRSLLTHSCVERGLDWHAGGADYSEGMVDMVGLTTTTDSLVAIRRAVFEERGVSLQELVAVLSRDWEGAESLRQYLLKRMPKFGNDDSEADELAAAETRRVNDHIKSHTTVFGGPWGMDIIGWSGAVELGARTGATPDGRRRGEALADCAGPAQGRNVLGLTPTLHSVLKLPHGHAHGPMALSLRFPRRLVEGTEGQAKLRAMIETYFREGGQQLQISIASTEEMRAAQRDPEAWRDLMVRVGGFSAYFTQLDRRFQDDLIARSEMEL